MIPGKLCNVIEGEFCEFNTSKLQLVSRFQKFQMGPVADYGNVINNINIDATLK
jgi:hypothetical protein